MENMAAAKRLYIDGLESEVGRKLRVLDVGAYDVNGSYRALFDPATVSYVGADLEAGPGVDVHLTAHDRLPFEDGEFDVVLSGQMLEHGSFFWESFREMARVVSPTGCLVVIAPSSGPIHRYPVDCYRFYPDAYQALADWSGMQLVDVFHDNRGDWKDLVGVFSHSDSFASATGTRLSDLANRLPAGPTRYEAITPATYDAPAVDALTAAEAAFWPIATVRESAWTGHSPSLFVLFDLLRPQRYVELGTHHGGSLFAACQARARLGLATECVGIDTWQGDKHAGLYGQEVLDDLRAALLEAGHDHALLERGLFDDVLAKFDDSSIDLLLIDGLHTHEAVASDFENWLPKMMPGGIVLLHDIREHGKDFGVWRLWEELEKTYETLAFDHAHGLGLVVVPGAESPAVTWIRQLASDASLAGHMQRLFETLGERSASHAVMPSLGSEVERMRRHIELIEPQLESAEQRANGAEELQTLLTATETQLLRCGDDRIALQSQLSDTKVKLQRTQANLQEIEGSRAMGMVHKFWRVRSKLGR